MVDLITINSKLTLFLFFYYGGLLVVVLGIVFFTLVFIKKKKLRIIFLGTLLFFLFVISPYIAAKSQYWYVWVYGRNHYSIKKGTLLWNLTIRDSKINNFPVLEPKNEALFNYSVENIVGVEIVELSYKSKLPLDILIAKINDNLKSIYNSVEFSNTACSGAWDGRPMIMDTLYSVVIINKDCINISFKKNEDNSTTVKANILKSVVFD